MWWRNKSPPTTNATRDHVAMIREPRNKFDELLDHCPICDSEEVYPRRITGANGFVCYDCGIIFLNPRMSDKATAEYYRGEYRDNVSAPGSNALDKVDHERQVLRSNLQIKLCGEYIKKAKTSLEIGCSIGVMMDALEHKYGITSIGVEPEARQRAVNKHTTYDDISKVPAVPFDLIVMSHSLEHLNHPREYLENLRDNHAHDGTRYLIEVPNTAVFSNSLSQHHPFAFTSATLSGLFDMIGYKPLLMVTHGLTQDKQNYLLGVFGKGDNNGKETD